jgi:NADPH:quinone reductase-like Zn-dependent oxidoreductase
MRALTIDANGGLEQLRLRDDLPVPIIDGAGQVRVRIRAAALNHLDLWTLRGLPNSPVTPGWILGGDGMGTVDELSDDVRGLAHGDRVLINPGISCRRCEFCRKGEHSLCIRYRLLGEHRHGTLAEYVVVPSTNVRRVADGVSDEAAAAYSLVHLTAWRMLVTRAQVRAGDEVLIWGIGGGVSLAALAIAKARGAKVWVTSSSQEKLAKAKALGADEVLLHTGTDVGKEVRARTGKRGVDVVVDSIGEATWGQSLGALARGGRLVTCGGTSGPSLAMDVRRLFWNQWSILGSTMGNDVEFEAVVAELAAGRLVPVVDSVHPLANGRDAFARLASGEQFGKVVVRISDG